MPQQDSPQFTTDAGGRRRPVPKSGVDAELIGQIQVVRDAHLQIADSSKPASTAERRQGRGGIGGTLGSFVLGEVFSSRNANDINFSSTGKVRFEGADEIIKSRFKKLTDIADIGKVAAASIPEPAPAQAEVEEWILCVTEPGHESKVSRVSGRLMKTDDVNVLQCRGSLSLSVPGSRVTLCPASAEDPSSSMCTGTVIVCVPGKDSCNIIFTSTPASAPIPVPAPVPEIKA
jgi:hypothetical protein